MLNEKILDEMLTEPSDALVEDIKKINGNIMILGAGGKMGASLCILAKNAVKKAGIEKKVIAVSRFSDEISVKLLRDNGIEIIKCDLLDKEQLAALPEEENIIFMAGRKFGTDGNEYLTWAMNSTLPNMVCDKFRGKTFVVFSSGNIYPLVPVYSGGCTEETPVKPNGEYTMSCLARERAFEYAAKTFGSKVLIYRLNYAVDLRYGVLCDIAANIMSGTPIGITTPSFNCIWQGSANEIAIRALLHATENVEILNVTGPETVSVKDTALKLGKLLGKEPVFEGEESNNAYLSNASKAISLFGYPRYNINNLIEMQADWFKSEGRLLGKPTHFEERKGSY